MAVRLNLGSAVQGIFYFTYDCFKLNVDMMKFLVKYRPSSIQNLKEISKFVCVYFKILVNNNLKGKFDFYAILDFHTWI